MLKKPKNKILILLISTIIISGYFFISLTNGNQTFGNLKLFLNNEQKELIRKYIFPYKMIFRQQQTISQQQQTIFQQQNTITQHRHALKFVDFLDLELKKKKRGQRNYT